MNETETLPVILNDRALRTPKTGVGHYVRELLRSMPQADPNLEYTPFYFTHVRNRAGLERDRRPPSGTSVQGSRKPWAIRRVLQSGYEAYFRAVCGLKRYRLYHEPNHIPMRFAGPTVTTVHDLSVLRFPQWHPADRVKWYEAQFHRTLSQTTRFIAVSEFTRREMIDLLGVEPGRITVVHNGVRDVFEPAGAGEYLPLLKKLRIAQPFFLFVGTLEPRKNLETLVSAYAQLPAPIRRGHALVLAGGIGWGETPALGKHFRCDPAPILTGYLDDEELRLLYSACFAFVWPSQYEGFGLPPVECMACGRPVITSNTSSIPEVVDDAALTVNPQDADALGGAMRRLVDDPEGVNRLIEAGFKRAGAFTWAASAAGHADTFRRVSADR